MVQRLDALTDVGHALAHVPPLGKDALGKDEKQADRQAAGKKNGESGQRANTGRNAGKRAERHHEHMPMCMSVNNPGNAFATITG